MAQTTQTTIVNGELIIQHKGGQPVDVVGVFKAHPEIETVTILDENGDFVFTIDLAQIHLDLHR